MNNWKKYLPTILIVLGIVVVVGFVVWALAKPDSSQNPSSQSHTITPADQAALKSGGTVGSTSSKVVVTEFGDYQCPACGQWHPFVKDTLLPQFQDKILFVFKNFPLTDLHKNAQAGAQAVEAAALQGKFWEMHNMLYDHRDDWVDLANPQAKFEQYARDTGLNIDQWKKDKDSQKIKDLIQSDVQLGTKLSLPGTPSFLINGSLVSPQNFNDLTNAINQALQQNQ